MLALCTGDDRWHLRGAHEELLAFEFFNCESQQTSLLVLEDTRWYLDLQPHEGACIVRLAHGQIGADHAALRKDCKAWPQGRFWKDPRAGFTRANEATRLAVLYCW